MNFRAVSLASAAFLLFLHCESAPEVSIPQFTDGGLLRTGQALQRGQLYAFEAMFKVNQGSDRFGESVAVRTSQGTVSFLTGKNAGFAVLGAACLPDRRVVLEGYWQYPTRARAGLVRAFVEPAELAETLCNGDMLEDPTQLRLEGVYGDDDDFPRTPLSLSWSRELKPWRGRFFSVAHHGACENTDHCGTMPNSLESIRLAERVGSNAAEVDVRLTRDGVPILYHDPMLSSSLVRGLFCNGQIEKISLRELRASCELIYGEVIPTLQEAMDMMVNETELEGVYLDLKVPDAVLPAARILAKTLADLRARNENDDPSDDRTFKGVIGIPTEAVYAAWQAAKPMLQAEGVEIPPCLIEYDPDLVIAAGCAAWGPTWTEGPQPENVQKVQAAGALTIFWTINQSEFLDAFLTTSHPNGIISARTALVFYLYQTIGTPPPPRETEP